MKTIAELDFEQWSFTISNIREISHDLDEFSKATQFLCRARLDKIKEEHPEYLEVWYEISSDLQIRFFYNKLGEDNVETGGAIESW